MNKPQFKRKLKARTMCIIQHNGWTCGTCFFSMSKNLTNEHWRAVLFYRGDNTLKELERGKDWDHKKLLMEVWEVLNHERI